MSWLVDSCVLLDVIDGDSAFADASARVLDDLFMDGLCVSPVTAVELAPAFLGDAGREDEFFFEHGVSVSRLWDETAQRAAQAAWAAHVAAKRAGRAAKRPVADILIGALALRHDGLVTRNGPDFARHFPSLRIVAPA